MPSKAGIYHWLGLRLGLYAMASSFPCTQPAHQRAHIAEARTLQLARYACG